MPISALSLNDNARCELAVMFYFETMSAPFAHKHDLGFVMLGGARYFVKAERGSDLMVGG